MGSCGLSCWCSVVFVFSWCSFLFPVKRRVSLSASDKFVCLGGQKGSPRRRLYIASLWPEPVSTFAFLMFPHLYLALPQLTWTHNFQGAPGLEFGPFSFRDRLFIGAEKATSGVCQLGLPVLRRFSILNCKVHYIYGQ